MKCLKNYFIRWRFDCENFLYFLYFLWFGFDSVSGDDESLVLDEVHCEGVLLRVHLDPFLPEARDNFMNIGHKILVAAAVDYQTVVEVDEFID